MYLEVCIWVWPREGRVQGPPSCRRPGTLSSFVCNDPFGDALDTLACFGLKKITVTFLGLNNMFLLYISLKNLGSSIIL